ncbi:MAG: glycosyltransferase family 2 protein [Eubacteriales bacterium]|nr:glycosyltransferase family 2 protein [Eubacteriales bacterium]
MDGLVSIVLPVYNGEEFLRESLDSIIDQTYKNWELLILDDCSTDNTPVIANEYATKDDRIKYIRNEKNLKLPGNLNKGFSLAKGEYLTWTSDDNKYRPIAIEKMLGELKRNSSDLVYASYQVIDESGNNIKVISADKKGQEHILGSNVVGACFMYTRRAYEYTGDYNVDLFLVEDFDYWQRMMSKYEPVVIDEVLYDYRWHGASLTSTKNKSEYGRRLEIMLNSNKKLYKKLSVEANYYFYKCLKVACDSQAKEFKEKNKLRYYEFLNKIQSVFRKLFGQG